MIEDADVLIERAFALLKDQPSQAIRAVLYGNGWTEADAGVPLRAWLQRQSPYALHDIVIRARRSRRNNPPTKEAL